MSKSNSSQQLWQETASGLMVPLGYLTDSTDASSETFLSIKQKALEVERLYADSAVPLPVTCDLARLIGEAKSLSDSWLAGQRIEDTIQFNAGHLKRIAEAILPLRSVEDRNRYLAAITSGSLSLHNREPSKAKDTLWEIELWEVLVRHGFNARLAEPPDIVLSFGGDLIGIACKKFYSAKNVSKVLSQAVEQIESNFQFGIVAANLDDLWPYEGAQIYKNLEAAGKAVGVFNEQFLTLHKRHFKKYLTSGRTIAALVSTDILAEIREGRARFNNAGQTTIWAVPGLEPEKEKQLKRFRDKLMGQR